MLIRALVAVVLFSTLIVLSPRGVDAQSVRDRLAKDVVVAIVDGEQILSSDLLQAFQNLPRQHQQRGLRAVYGQLLEQVIENKLLTIHGRLNNLAGDPEVKALVKEAEDTIIARIYMTRLISQSMTEESLRARYDELAKNTPSQEEVHARHILVNTEAEAKEVIKMIKGGQPFEEVAKTHSKDSAGPQGGDLGYFIRGDMVKPFSDAAFSMKAGTMTDVPVKTEFGWHVIKVEDKRLKPLPTFDEMAPEIRDELSNEAVDSVLTELRGRAAITIAPTAAP